MRDAGRSSAWYPLVGAGIGGLAGVSAYGVYCLTQERLISACVAAVMFILLSRGLHMDGLADSADAFFSNKPREEMLAIMKDPHIGAMGAVSIVCVFFLKVSFFSAVPAFFIVRAAVLAGLLSRYAMAVLMFFFPYARTEGTAKDYIHGMNISIFSRASLIAFICVYLIFSWQGIIVCGVVLITAYGLGVYSARRINGITGDVIGGIGEIMEIVALAALLLFLRGVQ